jgi:inositol-pentakisphosphate 2-kinase
LSEAAIGLFDRGSSSSFSPSPSSSCCVCASVVVALEIKPKAGHVACSPLVRRCHRIKYRLSRFAILQQLWVQGCVQKGWDFSAKQEVKAKVKDDNHNNHDSGGSGTMGATRSTSQYDPGDLLSSDRDRIERAIEGLLKTPQNNCRLSMDGNEVLLELGSVDPSSKKTTPTPGAAAAEAVEADWRNDVDRALLGLSSADRLQKANKGDPMMLLVRVCAEILFREPLLNQLAALQRLDLVLDADGAIAVHRRLVHDLCDGSIEKAEALVDNGGIRGWDWGDTASGPSPASHPLLDASPFAPPPTDPSRILQLCDLARQTKECLQEEKDGGDRDDHASLAAGSHLDDARRSDRLRELHEMALGVVEQLNSDDCVYLLRNWLLALAASDLSFFITLMRINDDGNDNDDDSDALAHNTSLDVTVTSLQSKNGLGTVEILWSDCGSDRRGVAMRQHRRRTVIRYQIKVIDFELKPARKLRDRHAKESPFSNMAM